MRSLRFLALYLLCLGTVRAESLDGIGTPLDNRVIAGTEVRFKVALSGAKDNVKIARRTARSCLLSIASAQAPIVC